MLERDRHTKAGLVRERKKKKKDGIGKREREKKTTDGIGKRKREREEHRRRERREAIPKKKITHSNKDDTGNAREKNE